MGAPVVSIDTKKKALVGNFRNNGETWAKHPIQVNDHDFRLPFNKCARTQHLDRALNLNSVSRTSSNSTRIEFCRGTGG
ncbi:MAG: hypothetical protein GY854_12710 [Deltaproteobacteria bacterium]|nr:hypothetical protein [Deltaproteobacteria bacterium]